MTLEQTIKQIKPINLDLLDEAQRRLDNLTKPVGSLGRLEEIARQVVAITEKRNPTFLGKTIITMAGDHGVAAEGVSAYPQEVTPQMVYNFLRGGAAINVLARHVGAKVVVVDMGVATELEPHPDLISKKIDFGTKNIAQGAAMSRKQAIQGIEAGIEVAQAEIQKGMDILGTGDMGIANTTPSSAIVAAITGMSVAKVTGRGTGIDDGTLSHKIQVIQRALEVNAPNRDDPIDVLAKIGGYEIGGIAGAILGTTAARVPVVIDGFISTAGALIATEICPTVKQYLFSAHNSVEIGHKVMLEFLGLTPIVDLNLRLGEGTGAALGIGIIEAAVKILNEMASFEEAGVSQSER
ncbi:TPA: nicotinate-nucleotide--dimethylbenzimidazole phosphoribosyltransferase [Candidatus Poribacteria bacterium]|nr:nicotinate-nucleotide--dimethylbenzimidazole phosphoribosyltransferase [Candidatus Poribacteria bacterium]